REQIQLKQGDYIPGTGAAGLTKEAFDALGLERVAMSHLIKEIVQENEALITRAAEVTEEVGDVMVRQFKDKRFPQMGFPDRPAKAQLHRHPWSIRSK
ncbi:MAG: hypothetical protein AAGH38_06195, partial [Pseudomonadota bacterium]